MLLRPAEWGATQSDAVFGAEPPVLSGTIAGVSVYGRRIPAKPPAIRGHLSGKITGFMVRIRTESIQIRELPNPGNR